MKANPVKKALREGRPQVGTWLSLGSVVAARFLARAGLPWLTVDIEHTHTDIQTAALMFGAIADAGCVPLARVVAGRHEADLEHLLNRGVEIVQADDAGLRDLCSQRPACKHYVSPVTDQVEGAGHRQHGREMHPDGERGTFGWCGLDGQIQTLRANAFQ